MPRAGLLMLFLLAFTLLARPLRAETARVILVHQHAPGGIVNEAITRIRGELVADGFEVSVVVAPDRADRASVLERAGVGTKGAVTLGLFLQTDAKAAELRVVDRLTNKTVVRRIQLAESEADSAPEVLARRSVELLRASLLEILVDKKQRERVEPSEPREEASRWVARAIEPRRSRFEAEAGLQVLGGFGGVGPALMPLGRLRVGIGPQLATRLSLSGFGTRPQVEATAGRATVRQELGLFELVGEVAPTPWLKPRLSLGAGAYHVGVDGTANSPYAGHRAERIVFAGDAGAGLALSLTSSLALAIEGHGILVTPHPVIRFVGVEAGRIGNPLVSAALTLVVQP